MEVQDDEGGGTGAAGMDEGIINEDDVDDESSVMENIHSISESI